jgi:S1-C subfamily serine protease
LSFTLKVSDDDLNLTDAQRAGIDRFRELQAAQTQEFEQAIRNLLTPEQRQKYDGRPGLRTYWLGQVEHTGLRAGFLGVSGNDASGGGAEVTQVFPETAASASGLQAGDVILDVNGQPIPGLSALSETIRKTGEGFAATLRIRRGSVEFVQGLQLGGTPAK